jgi:hypothetical protein
MSKRPPEDYSFIDKILKEFDASIDDVDVESKIAMKDALRESIQMWFPHIGIEPDIEVLDGEKQTVVDGIDELSEDIAAQKNALRSQLQVLDDDEDLLNEEDTFPNVQVRVLSPQDLIGGTHTMFGLGSERKPPIIKRGKIVLDVGEKRPLVQRREVSTYRLTCEQGKMYVRTEQDQYELRSGQSMDMDAMKIEIEAIDTTTGWYQSI